MSSTPSNPPASESALTIDDVVMRLQKIQKMGGGQKTLVIPYTPPHTTMGPRPSIPVTHVDIGFDWDQGKVFLQPNTPLGVLDAEQKAYGQKKENDLGMLLFSVRRISESEMFTPEERLRQISELVQEYTHPSPARTPKR